MILEFCYKFSYNRLKMRKINLKLVSTRFLFILLGVATGLTFMAQFRTVPDRITNSETPKISLREARELLYREQKDLVAESENLQKQNAELSSKLKSVSKSKDKIELLDRQRAIAGYLEVTGEGIVITLDDSSQAQGGEESIVHAADIRDVLNLLTAAGAEAVSINSQRLVFTTAVDCIVNTILFNNTKITSPFIISAVGDRQKIESYLNSPLNLADLKERKKSNGLKFDIQARDKLTIPAYSGTFILGTEFDENI